MSALQGSLHQLAGYCALVISDDDETGVIWTSVLEEQHFETVSAAAEANAIDPAQVRICDIILLVIMFPTPQLLKLIRFLRNGTDNPILLLLHFYDEAFLLEAFDNGVDDYIFGTISPRLLLFKIRAWLRRVRPRLQRSHPHAPPSSFYLDAARQLLTTGSGSVIKLTYLEFRLMQELMNQPGRVFEAQELGRRIWGYEPSDNTLLKNLVYRLRKKLERDPLNLTVIHAVPGIGYTFNTSP
jgi:two-component system OmpR family response regulator